METPKQKRNFVPKISKTELNALWCVQGYHLHKPHDLLKLSAHQSERFLGIKGNELEKAHDAGEVFPEFYILRVNDFDKVATSPLDEWIEFLKTGKINANTRIAQIVEATGLSKEDIEKL